ncbi:hypothetical protein HS125_07950 [bacterium]|nr:hypothetical protein [bacterium]
MPGDRSGSQDEGHDVIRVLERVMSGETPRKYLRSDNGPELIAKALSTWLSKRA